MYSSNKFEALFREIRDQVPLLLQWFPMVNSVCLFVLTTIQGVYLSHQKGLNYTFPRKRAFFYIINIPAIFVVPFFPKNICDTCPRDESFVEIKEFDTWKKIINSRYKQRSEIF